MMQFSSLERGQILLHAVHLYFRIFARKYNSCEERRWQKREWRSEKAIQKLRFFGIPCVYFRICARKYNSCEEAAEEGVEIWRSEKAPLATPPAPTH